MKTIVQRHKRGKTQPPPSVGWNKEGKIFYWPVSSNREWHSLYFLADVHIGAVTHDHEALTETVNEIKENPHAYWLGVGDYGDHIYYNDPRFSLNELNDTFTVADLRQGIMGQIRKLVTMLEPIKDKCIGLGSGNHEEKVVTKFNVDPTRELCFALRTQYLGYSKLMCIRPTYLDPSGGASSHSIHVYQHHGYGGGRRHGPQINKVEDCLRMVDANIYAMGHVHGKVVSTLQTRALDTDGNEYLKDRLFLVTSSYQNAYKQGTLSFAEKNQYPQSSLKSPIVQFKFHGEERKIKMRAIVEAG